jgi:hypothetical protein
LDVVTVPEAAPEVLASAEGLIAAAPVRALAAVADFVRAALLAERSAAVVVRSVAVRAAPAALPVVDRAVSTAVVSIVPLPEPMTEPPTPPTLPTAPPTDPPSPPPTPSWARAGVAAKAIAAVVARMRVRIAFSFVVIPVEGQRTEHKTVAGAVTVRRTDETIQRICHKDE